MSTIRTFTGRDIDLFELQPSDVDIVDIGHALSQICRWSGHTRDFYSVAQHSVLVAERVYARTASPAVALVGLLHDASEAYLGDMASPLKGTEWAEPYRVLEAEVTRAIATRFGLPHPLPEIVHDVDLELLATEARDLMPATHPWARTWPPPLPSLIRAWTSAFADRAFRSTWERYSMAGAAGLVL